MHNHVVNRGRKALLISFFITFFLFLFNPVSALAGAAEKWDYEVKPDTTQRLKVSGHQVDKYGAPANDYKYETTIDPKTTANRTKMGSVAINKLLKRANWAITGVELFQTFLEGIDWVIDPASQSIWRYKQTDYSSPACVGSGYIFRFVLEYRSCPIDAINSTLSKWNTQGTKVNEFVRFDVNVADAIKNKTKIYFTYKETQNGQVTIRSNMILEYVLDPSAQPPEKEYLTPESAADYANHTHPDFTNPKYAPRAEPLYKPEIQTDLWKPHNEWEYENSPTVQEAKQRLAESQPVPKDDKIKENEPDPETGAKSFSLPAFCSWATVVCEFVDWFKKDEPQENEEDETPQEINVGQLNTTTFRATPGCPQPIPIQITIGTRSTTHISYEPICQFASKWSFIAPLIGFLSGAMIIIGVGRKGEDSEI